VKDYSASPVPPSPYRWPVTIVLTILAPPLGLAGWILLSGSDRAVYLRSPWFKAGVAIICLGALPLVIVGLLSWLGLLSDPNPNPIGLGLLFMAATALGCIAILIGIVLHSLRRSA